MHLNLVARLVVIWTLVACALAFPSPTTPVGDTVWNVGDNVEIRWRESGEAPKSVSLSGINVYFMTGPNIGQIKLTAIAENLDKNATSAPWTVPELTEFGYPAGNIYFIMFTDSKNPDFGISWSTRFRVLDGSKEVNYNPEDPWPFDKSNSSGADGNDTNTDNGTDSTGDTDDAATTADTDNTDDTDDSKNSTDGGTTTIRSGPTPPPSSSPDTSENPGNTAARLIPTVMFVTVVVAVVVTAAFLA